MSPIDSLIHVAHVAHSVPGSRADHLALYDATAHLAAALVKSTGDRAEQRQLKQIAASAARMAARLRELDRHQREFADLLTGGDGK